MAVTNEVAVHRTVSCLCCSAGWHSKHSRGPLLCAPCFMSIGHGIDRTHVVACKIHHKTLDIRDVCPQATLTNGAYVPLVAR
jgi:hypothetical protein